MKRSMVLSIAIGSLILIMSLGANAYQHSQVKQAQQQISRLQKQKRQVNQQLTKANQQKQLLSTQIDSFLDSFWERLNLWWVRQLVA